MDYYVTLAQVVPLIYVALAVEGRLRGPIRDDDPEWNHPFFTTARVWGRATVLVGLPAIEAGVLIGIANGERYAALDSNIPAILFIAGLVLVCPPIWEQIEPFVPKARRKYVMVSLEALVAASVLALVGFGAFGIFPFG